MSRRGQPLKTSALLAFLMWLEKLVNDRFVDRLFYDFQYGFMSSRSTAGLLIVVSDRISRAFDSSGATRAVALDISKAFDRVWHAASSQTQILWNFQSGILPYFVFSQY